MNDKPDTARSKNLTGPVMQAGELADAVVEAAAIDNPGKEILVDDHIAYLRIQADGELILRRATVSECLGRAFEMRELEVNLSGFSGQIEYGTDQVRFYLEKKL
jgi:toluene monooxygenase system protein D